MAGGARCRRQVALARAQCEPRLAALLTAWPEPQVKSTVDRRAKEMRGLAIMLLVLCALLACESRPSPPSDAELLAQFEENKAGLQALLNALLSDPRMSDLEQAHRLRDGLEHYNVTEDEASNYRQRLHDAGVSEVWNHHRIAERYPIYFVVFEYRFYHGGVQKGFAWFKNPPDRDIVDALDERPHPGSERFRRITDEWHLFLR